MKMSPEELQMWLDCEAELMLYGRSSFYQMLQTSRRDCENAIQNAKIWEDIMAKIIGPRVTEV